VSISTSPVIYFRMEVLKNGKVDEEVDKEGDA